jgi:hypothetical protein
MLSLHGASSNYTIYFFRRYSLQLDLCDISKHSSFAISPQANNTIRQLIKNGALGMGGFGVSGVKDGGDGAYRMTVQKIEQ